VARIRDRLMNYAGYILIVILLALGCAGRGDKAKTEGSMLEDTVQKEDFKPSYPELIEMYNEGNIDEFYSTLDTIIIRKQSSVINRRGEFKRSARGYITPFSSYSPVWGTPFGVSEDSSLVTILILDEDRKLILIEFNDILQRGDYTYFNKSLNLESGTYRYLLKVESEVVLEYFGI